MNQARLGHQRRPQDLARLLPFWYRSKTVPKVYVIGSKGAILRAKAVSPNWCKTMGKRDLYEGGCVDGTAYEARGREFESLRAYHSIQ